MAGNFHLACQPHSTGSGCSGLQIEKEFEVHSGIFHDHLFNLKVLSAFVLLYLLN